MFRVIYINNSNDEIEHKGGFDSVSKAMKWIEKQCSNITALKLLVYDDYIDSYTTLYNL